MFSSEIRLVLLSWLVVIVVVPIILAIRLWHRAAAPKAPAARLRQSQSRGWTYTEFRQQEIACRTCDWKGLGADMNVGEVYETGAISDYHCPKCGAYWGAVPWPKIDQVSEGAPWKNGSHPP